MHFIIHLGDVTKSDFGLEQDLATYPVTLKLAALATECRQNV
jgi:hypothetical protein